MVPLRSLALCIVAAVLAAGCARTSRPSETADAMRVTAPVADMCEGARGEAVAPGLMVARSYAMANLAMRSAETRTVLTARGAHRFQVVRHTMRCAPYSVILSAGRMYRCRTSAEICGRA